MPQALADFHFLRPAWLPALLPCALLAWWFYRRRERPAVWSALIDPALLSALLVPDGGAQGRRLPWLVFGAWAIAVLALAGPAWERLPQPVHRAADALVIALDLGESMRATDLAPSRIERARFKLADLLAQRKDGQTALIVYAGDAHVVTPLSDDARTLAAMLPALAPGIMPAQGNDLPGAVALAGELLRGAGLEHGRLLVLTDRFPAAQHARVASLLAEGGLSLSLLATGTAAGAPVALPDGGFLRDDNGSIVVPALDVDTMRAGVAEAGGRFATLALDDSDIAALLPPPLATEIRAGDGPLRSFDQWQDRGPWLALALLPLAALAFRRGWLLGLALALLLPQPRAEALEWRDLWLSRDQQGARALAAGDAARAAGLFLSPAWRGAARYEAGDYAGAAEAWANADDAGAHYNRGNALARAGRLEEALAAYDAALAREPGMPDAVENRKLVEQALREQPAQQTPSPGSGAPQDGQHEAQQPGRSAPGEAQDGGSGGAPREGGKQPDGAPRDDAEPAPPAQDSGAAPGGRGEDPDASARAPSAPPGDEAGPARTPEGEAQADAGSRGGEGTRDDATAPAGAAAADGAEGEERAAVEQWLRQVPDEPGELLRRKFEYEYRARREGGSNL